MANSSEVNLTDAQNELLGWIKDYMKSYQHSPSIRQMMQAMGLKSPAPIQSRLRHLQEKGYISWQEGKARTLQIVEDIINGIPIMGSIAAGGLIETYADVNESLDISEVFQRKDVFALTVNGDSMIDACIANGDMVLMEPINDSYSLRNGTIVSAMVPGLGTTLKYFFKRGEKIFLEAANPSYEPIELNLDQVVFQGKLLAVWRKI
ncbi:repressor LexA [Prochlorococcus marinus XMU1419]|uniref:transcriptional repressor LexA n=1 Tax=Prochlorococcus marinus TaxID=1219 RepID=UPI001ADA5975|nr:transcriptional repressor LexA [Prochlorococcus marinus]MBO8234271.1 repressor LexA [Prochlorococcus marinus XMU1419]MBW3075961.1 repressor LexA [Prochlorococcus marinus str. XMU1419]|tara:strand:+ start:1203 stop:1820 length:618 start_codon:yes stop_codon:yes gene_type:complete